MKFGTKIGDYVKFDGKMWRVLYDDVYTAGAFGLQIICEDLREEILFRPKDVVAPADYTTNLTSETFSEENVKTASYVYDNIVKILNELCETLVLNKNYIHSVRSHGTNPIIGNHEDTKELFYVADYNAIEDMPNGFGLTFPHIISASRFTIQYENLEHRIRAISASFPMYSLDNEGKVVYIYDGGFYLLPIVTLNPGVLDFVEGEGTKDNPYILD